MESVDDTLQRAEAAYAEGDVEGSHEIGRAGLRERPDDPRLLAVVGRAALDLGDREAVEVFRRLVAVRGDDAAAWRDLGLAQVNEGDLSGAARAFREALARDPDDVDAQASLAHVAYAMGDVDRAVALLARVAQDAPEDPEPLRNLLEMYRIAGRSREALETAERLAARAPDDVIACIDLAELRLELGDHEGSAAAYQRMRSIDVAAGHATYAFHGLIEVELRRQDWRRALDLAIGATTADRHQLTTDLLAYVTAKLFGENDRHAPPFADLERDLAEQRAQHRRLHEEALVSERVAQ